MIKHFSSYLFRIPLGTTFVQIQLAQLHKLKKDEEEAAVLREENPSWDTVQSLWQKEMFGYVSLIFTYLYLCVPAERDQVLTIA